MTYEQQAMAWIQNSPRVEITIGRFTIPVRFSADRDWGWSWGCDDWLLPDEFKRSPEDFYFDEIIEGLDESCHDLSFIDALLEAMKNKPFTTEGESK